MNVWTPEARKACTHCAPEPLYYVSGRSVDGAEYLTGFGWSYDSRDALAMPLADATRVAAEQEAKHAATRGPDCGIYQIKARPMARDSQ